MVAFAFRRLPVEKLLALAAVLFIASAGMFAATASHFRDLDVKAHSAQASAADITAWNDSVANWGRMLPERAAHEVAISRAPFAARARHMIEHRGSEPFNALAFLLPETLALMLTGMACFRSGYFTGAWRDDSYRKMAVWSIGLGATAFAVVAATDIASRFYLPLLFFNMFAVALPFQVLMALGYAALIILVSRKPSTMRDRFAAVGRAAFTNYLGTSILAMLVFNGDGLALFERLSRFEAWLLVPLFWGLMLLCSKPWLDRFQYGPFEWLWRSLSRGKLQPMRKRAAAA
jgi:uncharacterized protein